MDYNITIAGNGIGESNFDNISLDISSYDLVLCDKSFCVDGDNIQKLQYKDIKQTIINNLDKKILYVVTGSVSFYSAGSSIVRFLKEKNIPCNVVDNVSSKSYLLGKLGISDSEVGVFSLHGRVDIDLSVMFDKRYTFVLCDEYSWSRLKEALLYISKDDYSITIGQRLGYADENISTIDIDYVDIKNPYVLLIEKKFCTNIYPTDGDFQTENGMITKQIKRDMAINALQLKPNQNLLDIGAGSGSVGICAYLKYKVKTTLIEKNQKRVKNILANIAYHKVVDTKVLCADASDVLDTLGSYDRIFIGGGGGEVLDKIEYIYGMLNDNGIIVANIVTLSNLTELIINLKVSNLPFDIQSVSIDDYKGELLLSEAQRMMYMIRIKK